MKKMSYFLKTLLIVSLLSISTISFAQDEGSGGSMPTITASIKGGGNFSYFADWYGRASGMKLGAMGGVGAKIDIIEMLAVEVAGVYTQMGGRDIDREWLYSPNSPRLIHSERTDIRLHNIDLMLMAYGYAPTGGTIKPKLIVGGAMGFNTLANAFHTRYYDLDENQEFKIVTKDDITERFKYYDWALHMGAGVEMDMDPFTISVDATYRLGLNDAATLPTLRYLEDEHYLANHSINLMLSIGYSFFK